MNIEHQARLVGTSRSVWVLYPTSISDTGIVQVLLVIILIHIRWCSLS